jgi:hypothetical protein
MGTHHVTMKWLLWLRNPAPNGWLKAYEAWDSYGFLPLLNWRRIHLQAGGCCNPLRPWPGRRRFLRFISSRGGFQKPAIGVPQILGKLHVDVLAMSWVWLGNWVKISKDESVSSKTTCYNKLKQSCPLLTWGKHNQQNLYSSGLTLIDA